MKYVHVHWMLSRYCKRKKKEEKKMCSTNNGIVDVEKQPNRRCARKLHMQLIACVYEIAAREGREQKLSAPFLRQRK